MERAIVVSRSTLRDRFLAFVAEQFPLAVNTAAEVFDHMSATSLARADDIDALQRRLMPALREALTPAVSVDHESTPGVMADARITEGIEACLEACDGFFDREAIEDSLTDDERLEILRGMLLTRATDTRLKTFFSGS